MSTNNNKIAQTFSQLPPPFIPMRLFANILILLTSLCLSGCIIPYKFTNRQEVSGHLMDYDSHQPVSDATITLSCNNSKYMEPVSILNETNGDFTVPSSRSWGVLPIIGPIDFYQPRWTLTITAPQYQTHTEEFRADIPLKNKPVQLGTIMLKKESPPVEPPPDSKTPP